VTNYQTNLNVNPSFENNLLGYTAVGGVQLNHVSNNALHGQYSMQVVTDGLASGEGFFGPMAPFISTSVASVGLDVSGETGTLIVTAAYNPDGISLATQIVSLTPAWQRVTLSGLTVPSGSTLYIVVQTTSAQFITYYVDGVQYEPETPAQPYMDGDTPGATWTGTQGSSTSFQAVKNPLIASGGMYMEGRAKVTQPGEDFFIHETGNMTMSGSAVASVFSPVAAFDDFAVYEITDLDPAMTYVGWNNALTPSGHASYSRNYSIFYPPLDYPVSDGSLLWPRAAYMAVGFEFANVAAGAAQNITSVQVEMEPLPGTDGLDDVPVPSTYDFPRAIHTIVKPSRLNYCPNPSIEAATTGWTANGFAGTTVSQDATSAFTIGGFYDGQPLTTNNSSLKTTMSGGAGGCQITLTNLIAGDPYIASAYVKPGQGLADLIIACSGDVSASIATGHDLVQGTWQRIFVIFNASASTVTLTINSVLATDVSYPTSFWTDCVLVEAGEILGSYFDGDFSNPDYLWETNGTPGLSRSYYYEAFKNNQATVLDILNRHTPLGLSWVTPLYAVPPTQ
jgi:hypothetical protein